MFEPHFGIDESGKGDFFWPLVIAGVYVDRDLARQFQQIGVADSKRISSDKRIRDLAVGHSKLRRRPKRGYHRTRTLQRAFS